MGVWDRGSRAWEWGSTASWVIPPRPNTQEVKMGRPTAKKEEPKQALAENMLFLFLLILLFRFHLCRISSAVLPHVRKVQTLHNLRLVAGGV